MSRKRQSIYVGMSVCHIAHISFLLVAIKEKERMSLFKGNMVKNNRLFGLPLINNYNFPINLQRRSLYYTFNIIIPCVLLSILTLTVFWMQPGSTDKVSLGLTVLLAFAVYMLLVAEKMPTSAKSVPLLGM